MMDEDDTIGTGTGGSGAGAPPTKLLGEQVTK